MELERLTTEARLTLVGGDDPRLSVTIGTLGWVMRGKPEDLRRAFEAAADRLEVEIEVRQGLKRPDE